MKKSLFYFLFSGCFSLLVILAEKQVGKKPGDEFEADFETTRREYKKPVTPSHAPIPWAPKKTKREPASISKVIKKQKNKKKVLKRTILGEERNLDDYHFANSPHENWLKYAQKQALKFQPKGTIVEIEVEAPHYLLKGNKALYVEEVLVRLIKPSGKRTHYKALVNSEDGRTIRTWDWDNHETFTRKPASLKPSGTL